MALACDLAMGRRSGSPGGGTASSTRRATARRWRACCRGSSAARSEIVVVCPCRGGYSPQQCHGKFRPVRATRHGWRTRSKGAGEGEAHSPPTGASGRPLAGRRCHPSHYCRTLRSSGHGHSPLPAAMAHRQMPGGYVVRDARSRTGAPVPHRAATGPLGGQS
jgi:hypothetical protein